MVIGPQPQVQRTKKKKKKPSMVIDLLTYWIGSSPKPHYSFAVTRLIFEIFDSFILCSNSHLPLLSLSSKSPATFPLADHRNPTREIIGPSTTKHGWPWWCISATIHGWDHLLQPHCAWEFFANETVGPTAPLHPDMGPQLHWWNFSLPALWLPLVFLHLLSQAQCFCS